jgi:hypothetical protein
MQRCHGALLRIRLPVILLWWLPSRIIYSLISIQRSATDKALMPLILHGNSYFTFHILDLILAVSKQFICQEILAGFFNFYSSYPVSILVIPRCTLFSSYFETNCFDILVSDLQIQFHDVDPKCIMDSVFR